MDEQERRQYFGRTKYRRYMGSKEWARVKAAYRASALPQDCQGCGHPKVELHHRSYERAYEEHLRDLVPVCRDCHQLVHDYAFEYRDLAEATSKVLAGEARRWKALWAEISA